MFARDPRDDDAFDPVLFTEWVEALTPIRPPAGLRGKVLNRIHREAPAEGLRTVRADEGWTQFMPGVEIKMLYRDEASQARSFLARLRPGVTLPAHEHGAAEECLVLEGEITQGDVTIRAGDYHLALKGARHGAMTTRTGALLFLRAGMDQHVPEPPGF